MRTLFHGGVVRAGLSFDQLDWAVSASDRIVALGSGQPPADVDRRIDLQAGTLIPAFCDAHVHLPATGLYAGGMDFRGSVRPAPFWTPSRSMRRRVTRCFSAETSRTHWTSP